jgi:hypothetical protein
MPAGLRGRRRGDLTSQGAASVPAAFPVVKVLLIVALWGGGFLAGALGVASSSASPQPATSQAARIDPTTIEWPGTRPCQAHGGIQNVNRIPGQSQPYELGGYFYDVRCVHQ